MTAPMQNQETFGQQKAHYENVGSFQHVKDSICHEILLDLMRVAYSLETNFRIRSVGADRLLDGYLMESFIEYARQNRDNASILNNLDRYIPKHVPNHRKSVEDFANDIRFYNDRKDILLIVNPQSASFKNYDLDFIAMFSSPRFLNTTQ